MDIVAHLSCMQKFVIDNRTAEKVGVAKCYVVLKY